MTNQKLFVLMIDGVSAEHFDSWQGRLPHLAALAKRGTVVNNLHSEVLGTSLPGRTSMMTGVTADLNGVYGNKIWDGENFRFANPDDVRVPTIPCRAKSAGIDTAVIGFGMIRPEDADIFVPPRWVTNFIERARDIPEATGGAWLRAYDRLNKDTRLQAMCQQAGYPERWPKIHTESHEAYMFYGAVADQIIMHWAGIAAANDDAPDLIVTEYLSTDTYQHVTGYQSLASHWSVEHADMLLGIVLQRLRAAGTLDQWQFAIMSDHGHSIIEKAVHPHVIIPDVPMQSEGSILLVAPRDAEHLTQITQALAPYDVEPFHTDYVPADHRNQIAAFIAPDKTSFEINGPNETEPVGKPNAISSHGLRPGNPGDDRFAVFAGGDIPVGVIDNAAAVQVAPTLAKLLGLPLDDFPAEPIF